MNLSKLKRAVDLTIEHLQEYQSPDDIAVLITTSEPSMGARSSCAIKYAGLGFDWESGQFRLDPDKDLVRKGNSLTDIKPVECRQYDGRNYYFCPRCQSKISKNDKFCRDCSQRLK